MNQFQQEERFRNFLKGLNDLAFIRSENSVTGKIEEFPEAVTDLEATIRIDGEWDTEGLKSFILDHDKRLIEEIIKKLPNPIDHICRLNDGDCKCGCYYKCGCIRKN